MSSVSFNTSINSDYIENLPYRSSNELRPVKSQLFFNALGVAYGADHLTNAVLRLLDQKECFSGVKPFKDRLEKYFQTPTALIYPDDQKYIANIVQLVSARRI